MERYILIEESESAHCCFKFTIIDTADGKEHEYWKHNVCECFEREDAELILNALNKLNSQQGPAPSPLNS